MSEKIANEHAQRMNTLELRTLVSTMVSYAGGRLPKLQQTAGSTRVILGDGSVAMRLTLRNDEISTGQ